jgi:octaprenyl-diphosphate synthase
VQIDFLKNAIAEEMAAVNRSLRESLASDVILISQIAEHIIGSGGKRLRPSVLVLSARACGYTGTQHHLIAAIVEMIHTSTLLHDDVVDDSSQRRGRPTANQAFGNAAPVLAGDFLYSRSFQLSVATDSLRILRILSDATNVIAEGEVLQLMNAGDPDLDEAGYMKVIERKTATLFEASARLGAVVANVSPDVENALADYGKHLGRAFQIMDDLLDYTGDASLIGKNLGDDLAEGKMTLPLIRAMQVGDDNARQMIRAAVTQRLNPEQHATTDFSELVALLKNTDAIEYTHECAKNEARLAEESLKKAALPDSLSAKTLIQLCAFAVEREF